MKLSGLLMLLLLTAACGKPTTKTVKQTQTYSLSSLQSMGISFYGQNGRVAVYCSETVSTNREKISALTNFKNSLGINNFETTGYTIGGVSLSPSSMGILLDDAVRDLQYANPDATTCPSELLSLI